MEQKEQQEKKPAYLVILSGQGDTEVKLVDQELWDWFNRPAPEFPPNEYSVDELPVVSERIRNGFLAEWEAEQYPVEERSLDITSGSWDNDRMLLCPKTLCLFSEYGDTNLIGDAKRWAKENGYRIAEKFEGCIY